jgi:signal transduction histidine kinase
VAYRLRVRRLTQQMHMRFEERLAERTRIARDLHDTLLQSTIAASLHLHLANESLSSVSSSPEVQEALAPLGRAMQLLSGVAEEGRATVSGLRTAPASGDIAEVLQRTANKEPNYRDIDFRVIVDGPVRPLRPQIFDEICRIACEALVNAYRHARARHIEVELVYTRHLFRCVVRDDGQGIDDGVLQRGLGGHWGLTGMRERAERAGGELHVRSRATAGTEVELAVPGRLAYSR